MPELEDSDAPPRDENGNPILQLQDPDFIPPDIPSYRTEDLISQLCDITGNPGHTHTATGRG